MIVQNYREIGCPARGNHRLVPAGEPYEAPDCDVEGGWLARLITGHVGAVLRDAIGRRRRVFILEHPRMDEIRENLSRGRN